MKAFLLFGVFGLVPLWIAIAVVLVGGQDAPKDYWLVAPWLLIFAVPACGVTLTIAAITIAVHSGASGDAVRKRKYALGTFAALLALTLAGVGAYWYREATVETQQIAGRALVESSEVVRSALAPPLRVSLDSTVYDRRRNLKRLTYHVRSLADASAADLAVAIVVPDRSAPDGLRFACVLTSEQFRALGPRSDPCQPGARD